MAEVQQSGSDGGGKNKQKKMNLRVDFTPMVDMNMLLITFFMMATTLLKPQTMDINMPAKTETEETDKNKVRESEAITLLLGADNTLYYFEGMIDSEEKYDDPDFLKQSSYGAEGIRQLLLGRNATAYNEVQALKEKQANLDITEEQFREQWKEIQERVRKEKKAPTVMIKPTELSTYKNMVDALDEMLITNIGAYAVVEFTDSDRHLLYKKTNNQEYLTDAQKLELAGN